MLHIFLDTSGSMQEMGKDRGVLYTLKSIIECIKNKLDYKIYDFASQELEPETLLKTKKFCDCKIDLKSLKFFLLGLEGPKIILSDGCFHKKDLENIKHPLFDFALSVGIDCKLENLKKLSKHVFESSNVVGLIDFLSVYLNANQDTTQGVDDEW
ncbi:hypothetical protein [Helicobacter cetorum]|uniref:hypothetical protein n=1 Tax=Helicobacter cetorum TaxID=138563 RepID=UPI000CF0C145|nr:hypothetical protein [Helicobacter cetorum]